MVKGSHYAPDVLARIVAARWGGRTPGYIGMHQRLRNRLGPAKEFQCVDCGRAAQQWSLKPETPTERLHAGVLTEPGTAIKSHAADQTVATHCYSLHLEDYEPRCIKCHVHLDGTAAAGNAKKTHCPQGHEYTPENTILHKKPTPSGVGRECRICKSEWDRRLRVKQGGGHGRIPKTHCPQGHPYSPENTRLSRSGVKNCITCKRAQLRAWRQKKRMEV